MPLETEVATYQQNRRQFVCQAGKFVLIHRLDVVDFFNTYEDAIKAGYRRFGLEPFLVKYIDFAGLDSHVLPVLR